MGRYTQTRSKLPTGEQAEAMVTQEEGPSLLGSQQYLQGPAGSQALEARQAGFLSHRLNLRLGAVWLGISQPPDRSISWNRETPFLG